MQGQFGLESNRRRQEVADQTRRRFLRASAAAVGATTLTAMGISSKESSSLFDQGESDIEEQNEVFDDLASTGESAESVPHSESFAAELEGYKAFFELRKDEVLFVDENNRPVGEPVPLRDIVGQKFHTDGRLLAEEYRFSVGVLNEVGLIEGGIPGEWIRKAREIQQTKYPRQKIARCLHATADFTASYDNQEEPELQTAIARGRVSSYRDLVTYFADKSVRGADEYTRLEYVQQMIQFGPSLPAVIAQELRRVIPGLCSQESKFNNGLRSKAGAQGIFQFMPENWAHYGGQPAEIKSLVKQVEIAGVFFSDLYNQVIANIGERGMGFLERYYGDQESLQRDLIVPLMINSYNAGAARVAEAVRLYIENTPVGDMPQGKDLFIAIADFALEARVKNRGRYLKAYGPDAREYVPRVYAQAEALGQST